MNLSEILAKIDISKSKDKWIDIETIGEDLNLDHNQLYDIDQEKNEFLRSTFIKEWMCTDTLVGVQAVFFKGEFVCLLKQDCRKCDKVVLGWTSQEKADLVREYLLSLIEEPDIAGVDIIDMDTDLGTGFSVNYVSQLIQKEGFYKDELVKIKEKPRRINSESNFHRIKIAFKDGREEWIDVRDLLLPWSTL